MFLRICNRKRQSIRDVSLDYSEKTALEVADEVIGTTNHNVKSIQHCLRTLRFFDLELLRVRDRVNATPWPFGWAIYLFFLIPNAIPAYGMVALFSGARRLKDD